MTVTSGLIRNYKVRQHGTYEGFKHGCDCDACWGAYKVINANRKKAVTPIGPKGPRPGQARPRKHGGEYAYRKGCRCELCVEYNRERGRDYRRRKGIPTQGEYNKKRRENPQHGAGRYRNGCRCDICRGAMHQQYINQRERRLEYQRARRAKMKEEQTNG